jgi:hypothetical protein
VDNFLNLLNDIGTNLVGTDCSNDIVYQEIFDAKKQHELNELPLGVWEPANAPMRWEDIEVKAKDILINKSKDLKVFSIFGESLIFQNGYRSLCDIFSLMKAMLEKYSISIFPVDVEKRSNTLSYIDKHWSQALIKSKLGSNITSQNESDIEVWRNYLNNSLLDRLEIKNFQDVFEFASKVYSSILDLNNFLRSINLPPLKETAAIIKSWLVVVKNFRSHSVALSNDSSLLDNNSYDFSDDHDEDFDLNLNLNVSQINEYLKTIIKILRNTNKQSMILPMLEKALAWEHSSLIDIYEELKEKGINFEDLIRILS